MRRFILPGIAGLLALSLAGCGGSAPNEAKPVTSGPIKVGVIPVADFAPVYVAFEEGYFSDAGLDVEIQVIQNAASIAPSVLNGQLQFGASAVTPFLAAAQKGLPIKAVANAADVATSKESDVSALVVAKGSGITRPSELENKTVAVNALSSIVHVVAAKVIKDDGGDPSKVTFVAMPFPDMMTALEQGRIDAASVVEPFATIAESNGGTAIARPYTDSFTKGTTSSLFFSSNAYLEKNPEIAAKFSAALAKGSKAASERPELVREVLVKYGKLDPAIASKTSLPGYGENVDPEALAHIATVMQDLGFLPGPVDAAKLIWKKQ